MYLSRINLDDTLRETMRALALPNVMHGAIEQSFPGERRRRLWRVDRFSDRCCLLVLSEDKPDFSRLSAQFCSGNRWETRDYSTLIERLSNGQQWQFRLCANPVHAKSKAPGSRGTIYAHVTQEQQCAWLAERAEKNGFSLAMDCFNVVASQWYKFGKGNADTVTLRTAVFEGMLTITDVSAFQKALIEGIGREKAYGCGLLTIMRPTGA